jgi:hypothetical protein
LPFPSSFFLFPFCFSNSLFSPFRSRENSRKGVARQSQAVRVWSLSSGVSTGPGSLLRGASGGGEGSPQGPWAAPETVRPEPPFVPSGTARVRDLYPAQVHDQEPITGESKMVRILAPQRDALQGLKET